MPPNHLLCHREVSPLPTLNLLPTLLPFWDQINYITALGTKEFGCTIMAALDRFFIFNQAHQTILSITFLQVNPLPDIDFEASRSSTAGDQSELSEQRERESM